MFWASGAFSNHDCLPWIKQKQPIGSQNNFWDIPVAKILSPVARQAPSTYLPEKFLAYFWIDFATTKLLGKADCFQRIELKRKKVLAKASTIRTTTITNEDLRSFSRFRFRNGKALPKNPPDFFRRCFRHEHVGHAQATTASHNYKKKTYNFPEISLRLHFRIRQREKILNPRTFNFSLLRVSMTAIISESLFSLSAFQKTLVTLFLWICLEIWHWKMVRSFSEVSVVCVSQGNEARKILLNFGGSSEQGLEGNLRSAAFPLAWV